jgi:hypothetical protein
MLKIIKKLNDKLDVFIIASLNKNKVYDAGIILGFVLFFGMWYFAKATN